MGRQRAKIVVGSGGERRGSVVEKEEAVGFAKVAVRFYESASRLRVFRLFQRLMILIEKGEEEGELLGLSSATMEAAEHPYACQSAPGPLQFVTETGVQESRVGDRAARVQRCFIEMAEKVPAWWSSAGSPRRRIVIEDRMDAPAYASEVALCLWMFGGAGIPMFVADINKDRSSIQDVLLLTLLAGSNLGQRE
ncbi:hypothetical protein G7Y89_g3489 [Cudoniella acicularis]|uniref:Uncharacterized protein n=1 Tax=Cudoniella acicularis TaxID=354080 RepID=A0A8H4W7K8_9HELO|nr:hypothetical protein G7Y89_g3489 [Cudoniella acicularis]